MALSAKKKKAIDGYLKGMTKVDAMRAAGYAETTSNTKHSAIFGSPEVEAEIARRQAIAATRADISLEWLTDQLKTIVEANIGDLIEIDSTGSISMDYSKLTPELRKAIGNVTVDEVTVGRGRDAEKIKRIRIGSLDKLRAIELLIKHLGLSKEKTVIEVEGDLVERLTRGRKRVADKRDAD